MSNDETKVLPEGQDKAPTTKPMLEAILAKVDDGFATMNARFDKVETRFDKVEKELRAIKRDQRTVYDQFLDLKGLHRELDERVAKLEDKAS